MIRITFIADTHGKHDFLTKMGDLPGGDILIVAGDITMRGYFTELENFVKWLNGLKQYTHKIFIAGNHDFCFEDTYNQAKIVVANYENITYLQDEIINVDGIWIYGTPWQPRFFNWAFNLDRNGDELKAKWDMIPKKTDLLITHGPPFGILDVLKRGEHMGCELLTERVKIVKPKIHVFGHNHFAYGYKEEDDTVYVNAAVVNEQYIYANKPITIDCDFKNNRFIFN